MQTKYGLPEEVRFCARCVISNQRPNSCREYDHTRESAKETIHFDAEGVCDACRVAEAKASIDWSAREAALLELCGRHRSAVGEYDCIVPGSGGKDSYYAAHILATKYRMHPLLVTWAPHLYTDWGWRNLMRWQAIANHMLVTPARSTHALLTRLAVENLFHPFQPFIVGQKLLAPKLAVHYGIELVFYGESEAEYGNPKDDAHQAMRGSEYWRNGSGAIHLAGCTMDELQGRYHLSNAELEPYMPVDSFAGDAVQVHYLGYYLRWKPQSSYYYAVEHGDFEAAPERTPGTYSKYNSIDDRVDDLHYWCTWIKYGIGRATYDAAQEIRSGDITRDEGVGLVKRFDGEWPQRFSDQLMRYLSVPGFDKMTKESFITMADKFRSPHLWKQLEDGTWELRRKVWE